jgi:plasmid stabilization system protein ParE
VPAEEPAREPWPLEEASDDVTLAFEWYESQRVGLGVEFVLAVDAAIEPLLRFPESGEAFYRDTRRCLVERFPFEVLYRVQGRLIVIVAVMHAARDPEAILRRVGG